MLVLDLGQLSGEVSCKNSIKDTKAITMAETMTLEPSAAEAAELQAQISHPLTEMKSLNEQMARDQERIDMLKSESRAITAETRVLMENLQTTLSEMSAA